MSRVWCITLLAFFLFPGGAREPDTVRIGLLIQDKTSLAAQQGAEMALRLANKRGGTQGRRAELVMRSMEGPWGAGSKQAVDLIFEEKVWALLGSHDGRNAHLVEQAATKSIVVFMSAWPSDPGLSQAYVPWFFNCVPDDERQADALIGEIYDKQKFRRVAVVVSGDYDSGQALKSFMKRLKVAQREAPVQFSAPDYARNPERFAGDVRNAGSHCVVLFCSPRDALNVIRMVREEKMNLPVYGTHLILNEDELNSQEIREFDHILRVPSGTGQSAASATFREEYRKAYGRIPGMVASYAFDGMNLLLDACSGAGEPDREKIQGYLSDHAFTGVSGTFRFDDLGSRVGRVSVLPVVNGSPEAGSN